MLTSPVMRNLADGAIPGTGNTGDESRKWELSWVGGVGGMLGQTAPVIYTFSGTGSRART